MSYPVSQFLRRFVDTEAEAQKAVDEARKGLEKLADARSLNDAVDAYLAARRRRVKDGEIRISTVVRDERDPGAVLSLAYLVLGARDGEIVLRQVRDVDDGGRVLWIPDSKTPAGRRELGVPDRLASHLAALARRRLPGRRCSRTRQPASGRRTGPASRSGTSASWPAYRRSRRRAARDARRDGARAGQHVGARGRPARPCLACGHGI